jgi:hypothetical protein
MAKVPIRTSLLAIEPNAVSSAEVVEAISRQHRDGKDGTNIDGIYMPMDYA